MMLSTAKDNPGVYDFCSSLFIIVGVLSSTPLAEHRSLTFANSDPKP